MLIKVTAIEVASNASTGEARRSFTQLRREMHINPDKVLFVKLPDSDVELARLRIEAFETWISIEDARLVIDACNQTPAAAAPRPDVAPLLVPARLVAMTRDETKNSQSPMWRCATEAGFMVNVFKHTDPLKDTFHLFDEAGYAPEMLAMEYNDTLTWTRDYIAVELVQNGRYWNVVKVLKRIDGHMPDEPEPDDDESESDLESAGYDGMGGIPWEGSDDNPIIL
jgi:hypothetical protein